MILCYVIDGVCHLRRVATRTSRSEAPTQLNTLQISAVEHGDNDGVDEGAVPSRREATWARDCDVGCNEGAQGLVTQVP